MRKIKEFEIFGVKYTSQQFSAMEGIEISSAMDKMDPLRILSLTSVIDGKNIYPLKDGAAINKYVVDKAEVLPPPIVLKGLIKFISDFNFGFLTNWKSISIPSRFRSDSKTVQSENIDPVVSQLLQNDCCSLKDLEQYYSLRDAYIMFDIIIAKSVNSQYAIEDSKKNRPK